MWGHIQAHPFLFVRVRPIAGQLASVERALTESGGCAAVLQQVAAIHGAVNGLMDEVLSAHLLAHLAAPMLRHLDRVEVGAVPFHGAIG